MIKTYPLKTKADVVVYLVGLLELYEEHDVICDFIKACLEDLACDSYEVSE